MTNFRIGKKYLCVKDLGFKCFKKGKKYLLFNIKPSLIHDNETDYYFYNEENIRTIVSAYGNGTNWIQYFKDDRKKKLKRILKKD